MGTGLECENWKPLSVERTEINGAFTTLEKPVSSRIYPLWGLCDIRHSQKLELDIRRNYSVGGVAGFSFGSVSDRYSGNFQVECYIR